MKWTTEMFTDPIIYIRKLESQIAEAQKQEHVERAQHVSQPGQDRQDHHDLGSLIQRLAKWMSACAALVLR
jgi:hypothetical protein